MQFFKLNAEHLLPNVFGCIDGKEGPLPLPYVFIDNRPVHPGLVAAEPTPEAPIYTLPEVIDLVKTAVFSQKVQKRGKYADELLSGDITFEQYAHWMDLTDDRLVEWAAWVPKGIRRQRPEVGIDSPVDIDDFNLHDLPRDEFVAWPLAEVPVYSIVAAPGGAGKSTWLLGLALHVAAGRPKWGNVTIPRARPVLYINMDDPIPKQQKRHWAMKQATGITSAELGGRFETWRPTNSKLMTEDGRTAVYEQLDRKMKEQRTGLLILDPLVRFHGLNENDNTRMSDFSDSIIALLNKHRAAGILAHHPPKGHFVADDDLIRGASSLATNARSTVFVLPGKAKGTVQVVHEKHSYTSVMEPATFRFDEYELPTGDKAAAMVPLGIGEPLEWEGREQVLQMVADGRPEGGPWSASPYAHADLRLDVAVDAVFGSGTAEQVLPAFQAAGLIKDAEVKVPKKPRGTKVVRAWVLCTAPKNPEAQVMEAESLD